MSDSMQTDGTTLSEGERAAANRAAIFAALRAAGACRATVSYMGVGDSGGPEGVKFEMPDGHSEPVPLPMVAQHVGTSRYVDGAWQTTFDLADQPLDEALIDFAMEAVEQHFGGWENGDGASGEVAFDAEDSTVTIEHNTYFTDSEFSKVSA